MMGYDAFCVLDLSNSYHQIEVAEEDRHKTAFTVDGEHLQFKRGPMGISTISGIFQAMINSAMSGLVGKGCECYQDDVLMKGKGTEDLVKNVRAVFERMREYRLKANPLKTVLLTSRVKFLGMICSKEGIQPDPKDLVKVQKFPIPKDLKQVMTWNGLATYYSKFVPNFANIMDPVRQLMKKDAPFTWTEDCQKSFELIKEALTNPPILAYPDGNENLELYTDASIIGLGAVLEQRGKPIGYAHKTLLPAERNYSTTERELLSLVWACNRWRHILLNSPFRAYVDHKPLTGEIRKKNSPSRLMRFKVALSDFDFEIVYKKGKEHGNADAMSRMDDSEMTTSEKYDGHPYWALLGGHRGMNQTYERIKTNYYWKGMKSDIYEYVKSCSICQKRKNRRKLRMPMKLVGVA